MNSQKIFDSLSGVTLTDKLILLKAIDKYGRNEKNTEEVKKIGFKLYEILVNNGLNESIDKIDKERLLEKADNCIYVEKYDEGIEILKVLESQEDWSLKKDGNKIYYFNNEIEAQKFSYLNPNLTFCWKPSVKNEILSLLINAEIKSNKTKEAKRSLKFLLTINPVSVVAKILEAKLEKNVNLENYKSILMSAFDYAYTQQQFAEIYKDLSYYFEQKSDFETAYCLMRASVSFSDSLEIEIEQKKLHAKFKDVGIKLPEMEAKDVENKLLSLNIPIFIKEDMFLAVCDGYISYLESGHANIEGKELYRNLISSMTNNQNLIYDLEDSANLNDNGSEEIDNKKKKKSKKKKEKQKEEQNGELNKIEAYNKRKNKSPKM